MIKLFLYDLLTKLILKFYDSYIFVYEFSARGHDHIYNQEMNIFISSLLWYVIMARGRKFVYKCIAVLKFEYQFWKVI